MVYEGSGPDWRDRAESWADFASCASRHGKDMAGLDESLAAALEAGTDCDFCDRVVCSALYVAGHDGDKEAWIR